MDKKKLQKCLIKTETVQFVKQEFYYIYLC